MGAIRRKELTQFGTWVDESRYEVVSAGGWARGALCTRYLSDAGKLASSCDLVDPKALGTVKCGTPRKCPRCLGNPKHAPQKLKRFSSRTLPEAPEATEGPLPRVPVDGFDSFFAGIRTPYYMNQPT